MNLLDYLKESGLTQRQFAHMVDETEATISRVANSETWISERVARKILRATNGAVTPNDFLVGVSPLDATSGPSEAQKVNSDKEAAS